MMRSVVSLVVLSSLALGAGCAFRKPDEAEKDREKKSQSAVDEVLQDKREKESASMREVDLVVNMKPLEQPRHYLLVVTWPRKLIKVELKINDNLVQPTGENIYEREVESNEKFNVQLASYTSGDVKVSTVTREVDVPIDETFFEKKILARDEVYDHRGRIFFGEGVAIYLNGYNLSIDADEILFKNSTIATRARGFKDRTKDKRLLKGPSVLLRSRKLTGHGYIDLIGFDGAEGQSGRELISPDEKRKGLDGLAGVDEKIHVEFPAVNPSCRDFCFPPPIYICDLPPGNGEDGEDGLPAKNGEDGYNGGGTGNLTIVAEEYGNAIIDILAVPGKGGLGGAPKREEGLAAKAALLGKRFLRAPVKRRHVAETVRRAPKAEEEWMGIQVRLV